MGFLAHWVKLVMECVSAVNYKVKFDDSHSAIFFPKRGLRQGDPLSPYLFILCKEWLSITILSNVATKRIEGVRMGRGAPEMTHLFFADDSLFFLKATFQNVVVMKEILEDYQFLSGQRINFLKSEVVYSRIVPCEACDFFTDKLAVRRVDSHGKYLGLPIGYGGRKTDMFKFLVKGHVEESRAGMQICCLLREKRL